MKVCESCKAKFKPSDNAGQVICDECHEDEFLVNLARLYAQGKPPPRKEEEQLEMLLEDRRQERDNNKDFSSS